MGELVSDDVRHTLELGPRRLSRVYEESGVSEGDAAQVLHGAGSEVRDGDEVHLVAGIGDVEIVAEEPERDAPTSNAKSARPRFSGVYTIRSGTPSTSTVSVVSNLPTTKATR